MNTTVNVNLALICEAFSSAAVKISFFRQLTVTFTEFYNTLLCYFLTKVNLTKS